MVGLCPDEQEVMLQISIRDLYSRADLDDLGNHVHVLTGAADGLYWVIVYVRHLKTLYCSILGSCIASTIQTVISALFRTCSDRLLFCFLSPDVPSDEEVPKTAPPPDHSIKLAFPVSRSLQRALDSLISRRIGERDECAAGDSGIATVLDVVHRKDVYVRCSRDAQ